MHRKDGVRIPPQTTPPPFKIIVNATSLKPGDVINVKLDGGDEMFKGLFLQIRPVKKSDKDTVRDVPLGSFRRIMQNTEIMGCDVALDTLVHEDGFLKFKTEFNWISPLLMKNDVVVRATILVNYTTYWVNVESDVIRLEDVGPLPAEGLERPWLKEIISTVQKKEDVKATEDAVVARFEKGFNGAIDPDGHIMIHYVIDLLPFEDSTMYGKPQPPPGFDVRDNDDSSDVKTSTGDLMFEAVDNEGNQKDTSANVVDEPSKATKADTYYEVLLKAVLGGDKIVADALEKLI